MLLFGGEGISLEFKNKNFGVGCPGGVEAVAHSLRDALEKHSNSKMGLLKIDFRNAFNLVDRDAFVQTSGEMFPGMSQWTQWCYGSPSLLLFDHKYVFHSTSGVQQGVLLGLFIFVALLLLLLRKLSN